MWEEETDGQFRDFLPVLTVHVSARKPQATWKQTQTDVMASVTQPARISAGLR